jgi:hypothetical protein
MSKTLFGLLAATVAVIGLNSAPARADVLYVNSDGTMHTFGSDVMLDRTIVSPAVIEPTTTTQIITQPAVIDTTPVVTTPVMTQPVLIDRRRNHLLDVGIPGLFGIHLF